MLLPEWRTTRAPAAPRADDACDDPPESDAEDEIPVSAPADPAASGEPDAGGDAEEQHDAVHVQRQRPEVERAAGRRGDVAEDDAGYSRSRRRQSRRLRSLMSSVEPTLISVHCARGGGRTQRL